MTDLLLEVSRRKAARRIVESLGVPLPLPRVLERASETSNPRELSRRVVSVLGFSDDDLSRSVARVVAHMGATVSSTAPATFRDASEAFGIAPARDDAPLHALLVDATCVLTVGQLRDQFAALQSSVRRIGAHGRLVVFARSSQPAVEATCVEAATVSAALEGFVRSAAKELGRRGATANLIVVDAGADHRAAAIARFFLSPRSAFVTAQPIRATLVASSPSTDDSDPTMSLDRKVAVVTGAARGIGEASARRLAEKAAHVVCVDRPADETAVARVVRAIGGSVFLADVASPETPGALAEHLRRQHGGVDIIVHNAGITRDRTFAKMSADEWNAVIDVNLGAVVAITDAMLPVMRDGGRIVCLSSVAGIAGNVGQTNYAASKAGLIGYVRALAQQVAPRGITANAVAPGFIETRMTAAIPFAIREAGRRLSALGQGGQPVDVAEAITFLATPAAIGVTGATLRVCGGALIGA